MRTTLLVFAIIFAVVAVGMGSLLTWRDFRDSKKITDQIGENEAVLGAVKNASPEIQEALELPGKLKKGGIAAGAVAALALVVVFSIGSKKSSMTAVAGVLAIAALAMIFLNPSYATGHHGPASARMVAWVAGVPALLLAASAAGRRSIRA